MMKTCTNCRFLVNQVCYRFGAIVKETNEPCKYYVGALLQPGSLKVRCRDCFFLGEAVVQYEGELHKCNRTHHPVSYRHQPCSFFKYNEAGISVKEIILGRGQSNVLL